MEKIIKKNLDFLCKKYNMKYSTNTFKNYLDRNVSLDVYNYYNSNGCFSILSIEERGDLDFAHFDRADFIKKYVEKSFIGRHIYLIDVEKKEEHIWNQHKKIAFFKNPFFWWSKKKVFCALAEVIEVQIQKTGYFYGIKINN